MGVSYEKLQNVLISKGITMSELRKSAKIAPNTMTKLRKDEEVSLSILGRICSTLNLDYGDIMTYIKD